MSEDAAETDWRDMVVSDRMAVDREFGDRVDRSQFTRQEWGLIMTAAEFHIEHPEDPERARIVADTSSVPAVVPQFENLREAQAVGAGGGIAGPDSGGGGLLDSVKRALGLDGGDGGDEADEETLAAAQELADEYAAQLQERLERRDRWDDVRAAAAE